MYKRILYLLPFLIPVLTISAIYLDSVINDVNPMQGEQGLGTVGLIFSSIITGLLLPFVIILFNYIAGKLKNS